MLTASLWISAAFVGGMVVGAGAVVYGLKRLITSMEEEADFSMAKRFGRSRLEAAVSGPRLDTTRLKIIAGAAPETVGDALRRVARAIRQKETTPGAALAYRYIIDAAAVEDLKAKGFVAPGDKVRVR